MALTARQVAFYLARMWVYRPSSTKDSSGDPIGNVVPIADLQNIPCKLHETMAFDVPRAPGISINQDTIQTADELRFEVVHDIRERDLIKVVEGGQTNWYRVAGNVRRKPGRANSAHAFLQRTNPPRGVS